MDLIDREKLVQEIKSQSNRLCLGYISTADIDVEDIVQLIVDAQTVDVYTEQDVRDVFNDGYSLGMERAVRHGKWERTDITEEDGWALYRCSCCNWHTTYYYSFSASPTYNYCPKCGAKMDGD